MLVAGFPATALATNCYVVAPGAGADCVVIDPGVGTDAPLADILDQYRLKPAAVLLTHGHFDHTLCAASVCRTYRVGALIHAGDRGQLADPMSGLPADLAVGLTQLIGGAAPAEPDTVTEPTDGAVLRLAGLEITVDHAPGHTPGSLIYRVTGGVDAGPASLRGADGLAEANQLCFTGDVLFAGSIGRMDLPGGDPDAMAASLRRVVLSRDDTVGVLPGHGGHTTIGRERRTNPYLVRLAADPAAGLPVG